MVFFYFFTGFFNPIKATNPLLDKPHRRTGESMEEKLNNLAKEVFLIQQDRMLIINKDNARFAKLEKSLSELIVSDKAQITVNQLFDKQFTIMETKIKTLETRLKKEETKPLVTIPSSVPSAWNVPASTTSSLPVNKWWWFR
mgnify:CR=1 FL=1